MALILISTGLWTNGVAPETSAAKFNCPDWIENSDEINDSGFSGLPGGGRMVNGVFYNNIKKGWL